MPSPHHRRTHRRQGEPLDGSATTSQDPWRLRSQDLWRRLYFAGLLPGGLHDIVQAVVQCIEGVTRTSGDTSQ